MKTIADLIEQKPLVHVQSTDMVRDVARRMTERNIGAVPVLDRGALVGMFTERDLMTRVVAPDLDADTTPIESVMTRDIAIASPEDGIAECLEKMHAMKCRHLPVTDGATVIGMVSLRDLLQVDRERARNRVRLLNELVRHNADYES